MNPKIRGAVLAVVCGGGFLTPARGTETPAEDAALEAALAAQAGARGCLVPAGEIRDLIDATRLSGSARDKAAFAGLERRLAACSRKPAAAPAPIRSALGARVEALQGARTLGPGEVSASLGRIFGEGPGGGASDIVPAVQAGAPWGPAKAAAAAIAPLQAGLEPAPRREHPRGFVGEAREIAGLSDQVLARATPAERAAMLKTLIRASRPDKLSGGEDPDSAQAALERAIVRVLASAPDAAAFDYAYYRSNPSALARSGADPWAIDQLLDAHRGSARPGDWAGLDRYVDTVAETKSAGRNIVQFLIDGGGVLEPGRAVIDGARKSIHLEVFEWEADEIGWRLAARLAAKARAGVRVRVMLDGHGSRVAANPEIRKLIAHLRESGATVIVQKPPLTRNHVDHRKVMVVDGDIAFIGGMNIGRHYQELWHDQQTLVRGPAVAELQDAFLDSWKREGGAAPEEGLAELYPPLREEPAGAEVRVVRHEGGGADQNIKAMYLRAFGTSEKSIRIANPYFMDADVVAALARAAKRGVKVQVFLPEANNQLIVQRGSRAYYPDLLAAGIEVYEYEGRMAHEKVCTIDGTWATFGSSNLDARSLWYNDELNLAVSDAPTARYIDRRLFDEDIARSRRILAYRPTLRERIDRLLGGYL